LPIAIAAARPGEPMRTKHYLSSADVKKMVAACLAEAEANTWSLTIVVVDEGGFLLHLDRMDGAALSTVEVAIGKARTSAFARQPSKVLEDRLKERPAFLQFPFGIMLQGALPIMYEGACVGAIGVSGAKSDQDEQVARAGLAAFA
jgi:glc operon protein GlcG